MRIRRAPLVFNNVITVKERCGLQEWYSAAREFRNQILRNGLYGIGPFIYQVAAQGEKDGEGDFIFHLPVNAPIQLAKNSKYFFSESWQLADGFVIRHADLEVPVDESYALLSACAEAHHLTLREPFYHIYLDVFGGGIIDIYAPIAEEDSVD